MLSIACPPRPDALRRPLIALTACVAVAAGLGATDAAGAQATAADSDVATAGPVAAAALAPSGGRGGVTLRIGRGAKSAKALAAARVTIRPIAPARRRGARLRLPVRTIAVGRAATVALRGGIRFVAGKRVAKLRSLRLRLTAGRATVSARTGGRRIAVVVAKLARGRAKLDRSGLTAKLAGARVRLTARAARLLRARLAVRGLRAGGLGRLRVDARSKRGTGGAAPRSGGGGGARHPGGPGSSGPGPGAPTSGPISGEPPVLTRPATAVDVGDIEIVWYPRDSWIRYLTSGIGTATPENGFFASGGATKAPATTSAEHPCSDVAYGGTPSDSFDFAYRYAPRSGWYDPETGAAAVYGAGSVRFRWQSHGIDLVASDPEIELGPGAARTIFRLGGSGGTAYPDQRAALTELDMTGQPTVAGATRTYTAVAGRLTADGQAVFAGFYPPPNDGFGCVTVSFATPVP